MNGATWTADDLRLLRVARRIRASRLATPYGASRQRICNIEKEVLPSRENITRYLAALQRASAE